MDAVKKAMWEQAIQSRLWPTPGRYASDADLPVLPDKDGNYPVALSDVTVVW
ncbi:MAG: hypothetical protein ACLQNE_28100 [Thermoguttaceae bacterium]